MVRISCFDNHTDVKEYHVMLQITNPHLDFQEQLIEIINAYTAIRKQLNATSVFKRYFLSDAANQSDEVLGAETENSDCALSVIQQPPLNGTKIALWAYLMTSITTRTLANGLFEVAHNTTYRHLWTSNAYNLEDNAEYQTRLLLNHYVMQLTEVGCNLSDHCIRTWFFVNDIDNHYQGVVKARNDVFYTQNLTQDTHFIASTGIGGRQANSKVYVQIDAYAVAGLQAEQVHYLYALDHMNRTSDYGVSFERGTTIDYGDRRHIFISGTASIDKEGNILYPHDIIRQTKRMWENVESLLQEADCTFENISEITVYLRDPADYEVVYQMFEEKFPSTPFLIVGASVCRPGWLIEMECMGAKEMKYSQYPDF
ncbi:MAG: Rid family hydrolase [Prevotella sp.]|nr:Rid family hydrolase [Prevotella sp.]